MNRKYMDLELNQTTSYLAKLISKGSFLRGNPVVVKRVCGRPNCRCVLGGNYIHRSTFLKIKTEIER